MRGSLVAEHSREQSRMTKGSVEVLLSLHGTLGDLIQMSTDSSHLESNLALVESVMTVFAETEQVCQRILPTMLTEYDVVCFQMTVSLAAVLAGVSIAQETGNTEILV